MLAKENEILKKLISEVYRGADCNITSFISEKLSENDYTKPEVFEA